MAPLTKSRVRRVQLCKKVPHLEDSVLCVGFPVGGDTISVTSGVVSRVEVMTYAAACSELLGHPAPLAAGIGEHAKVHMQSCGL